MLFLALTIVIELGGQSVVPGCEPELILQLDVFPCALWPVQHYRFTFGFSIFSDMGSLKTRILPITSLGFLAAPKDRFYNFCISYLGKGVESLGFAKSTDGDSIGSVALIAPRFSSHKRALGLTMAFCLAAKLGLVLLPSLVCMIPISIDFSITPGDIVLLFLQEFVREERSRGCRGDGYLLFEIVWATEVTLSSILMGMAKMPPDNITLMLDFDNGSTSLIPPLFYIYLHFSELSMPKANDSRVFQVELPGTQPITYNMTSKYLVERHVPIVYQVGTDPSTYYLNLTKMPGSTRPPLINAMEVYSKINLSSIATDGGDGVNTLY
ncbi:hypothetical protein ZIOFF_055993 [Zingiber officinale]|uniref:Malectin-like domain-containing protein n=1 Tax=Zingiber officinale TaxID=94328 RepID=A0A8J5FGJ7_ZINOF|nr:hypothetical protein ZIOFF_055993 [Zingiber officinale]